MTSRKITKRTKKWVKYTHADHELMLAEMKALSIAGATRSAGEGGCCEEVCKRHGGCDFGGETVAVCNDGDVIICNPEA